MKYLIILMGVVATLASCSSTKTTIAKGKIEAAEPYKVYVREWSENNKPKWVRWHYWEMYDAYDVKAQDKDRIRFIFVSACSKDTTTLIVNAGYKKERIKRNIYLDGSTYELGSWPFETEVADNDSTR